MCRTPSIIGYTRKKYNFCIFVIMETTDFTREQLAQYILNTAKDSVVNKTNKIIPKRTKRRYYCL